MGKGPAIRALPTILLLFWFALIPTPGWGDASDHYQNGMRAFKAGDYEQARQSFEQARAEGMDKPTLHYNIGVVHFKLTNYAAARESFERIATHPEWGPLALYNLGLIAERTGHFETAQRHFADAARQTDDPKVRALAQSRLAAAEPTAATQPDHRWTGFLSSAVGFDDNVTLAGADSLDIISDEEDLFLDLIIAGNRYLKGSYEDGWRAELVGYYRKHQDLDEFDYGAGTASIMYNRLLDSWHIQAGAGAEFQFVASDPFATMLRLRARAYRTLGDGLAFQARHDSAYIDATNDYDYLTGWQHRTSAELTRRMADTKLRIGYQLEFNDRDDLTFDDEFFSYSPMRHRIYLEAQTPISPEFTGRARLGFRTSRSDEKNIEINPDNSVTEQERDEDRLSLMFRLEYSLSADWQLFSEYNYADNDSNFDRQSYENHLVMIGLQGSF